MSSYIACGFIDDFNSSTSHTLSVGFQPKGGVFWFLPASNTNQSEDNTPFSIGFWAYIGNSHVQRCHATHRSQSGSGELAAYTDCVAAFISSGSRLQYLSVTGVSSTGLTLTLDQTRNYSYKRRLHWILFGGDIQVSCGHLNTPNNASWSPITATGHGFDVLFASFIGTQSSSPSTGFPLSFCIAHHDKAANVYRFSTHTASCNNNYFDHEIGSGTAAKIFVAQYSFTYINIDNVNNGNDLRISRNYSGSSYTRSSTFSYLSIRSIPAWSDRFTVGSSSTWEEQKSYTLAQAKPFFMATTLTWGLNTYERITVNQAFSTIMYSTTTGSTAFSIVRLSNSIYNYSSSDKAHIVYNSSSMSINSSYWKFVSYSGNTWNFATRAISSGLYIPVFILGLGDISVTLQATSNSQKYLSRWTNRIRTYIVASNSNALLSVVTPFTQILSAASNGLATLRKALSRSLSSSSGQTSTLRRRQFRELFTSNSYVTSLKLLTRKLLHVVSDYFVFIRLPLNTSQTLVAASDSLVSLFKRLFVSLGTTSEHESLIERTILIILRAFSSWLAWMEFMIFKVLEVVTDTRNDIEREVTNLFRSYEQELSAISSSVSKIAKTFFRTLVAESFQWVRMDRIRGPVFALRSWLWRVNRRKHGCQ